MIRSGVANASRRAECGLLAPASVFCLLLSSLPATGVAQEVAAQVVVQVRLVSEGGGEVTGASFRLLPLDSTPAGGSGVVKLLAEGDGASLRLQRGRSYQLYVDAPGHQVRTVTVSSGGPTILRIVLPLDPYELPAIAAKAGNEGPTSGARSVYQARFADQSLTYSTVAEWLRDVPGVSVRGTGPGGAQVLSVRGSRPEDVLVLLDGVSLNDPLTGRADLSMIPTSTLESGTLVRGAASQRYGSGASAGVLLLTSRTGEGSGLSAGGRTGSFGVMEFDVQADASRGSRRLGLSIAAARADNDFLYHDPVVGGRTQEVRTNADVANLHGVLHAEAGPVFGSIRVDGSERGVPGRAGTSLFEGARAEDRSWVAAAGLAEAAVRASASYGWRRLSYRDSATDPVSAQEVRELRLAGDVDLPATPVTMGGRVTREAVEGDAIYGDHVRTVVGARVAAVLTSGRLRLDPALGLDTFGERVIPSPELSATWLASSTTRLWARIGQGFRLATFGDLYFASQYQLRPNPDLEPERISFDSEIGASVRATTGPILLGSSLTAWARRTENPIVWLASSAALWSPRNLGELRASGLEVQVELAARDPDGVGWRMELAGSFEHSRVGFGSNRNPLPYEPGTRGRLSLEIWRAAIGTRLDLRYTGPRTTGLAATRSLDGFSTVDASAHYHFEAGSVRLGLFGSVENILDQRYQLVELFPEPGRHFALRLEARRAVP